MKSDREILREVVSERQNGQRERSKDVALLERDARRNEGNPQIVMWCPACEERSVPMRDGSCGFCGGALEVIPDVQDVVAEDWPHTTKLVRRTVPVPGTVSPEGADVRPASGPLLVPARKANNEDLTPEEARAVARAKRERRNDAKERSPKDPTRSPILEFLEERGPSTASSIAEVLERAPRNVSTRLRQLEKGGFLRRTGRSIPGGRGGPQIEWELASDHKEPTNPEIVLETPRSTTDFRLRYFEALLSKLEQADCPEHVYDRLERLCGLA